MVTRKIPPWGGGTRYEKAIPSLGEGARNFSATLGSFGINRVGISAEEERPGDAASRHAPRLSPKGILKSVLRSSRKPQYHLFPLLLPLHPPRLPRSRRNFSRAIAPQRRRGSQTRRRYFACVISTTKRTKLLGSEIDFGRRL